MTLWGFPRRAAVLRPFLWPDKEARKAIQTIRKSGQFDRNYYITSNPRIRWIFRLAPLRHYVTIGEKRGLCPNPWFSPVAFRRGNRPLSGCAFLDFLNYVERRPIAPVDRQALDLSGWHNPRTRAPFAVVLHLYYPELWPEIKDQLVGAGIEFDLFVSLSGDASTPGGIAKDILAAYPDARIALVPNKGRDMLPFVLAANSGALLKYRAVAKIHGKLSPHLPNGTRWRRRLIAGLFPPDCAERLDVFDDLGSAQLWTADSATLRGDEWWGSNRRRAAEIYEVSLPERLSFPAGGMFWVKPSLIARLASLGLNLTDFEDEMGFVDGTTAHAIERLMGVLALEIGGRIVETRELGRRNGKVAAIRAEGKRDPTLLLTG